MTADEIIAAARAEIGTPFRHQGRLPGRALDCAGLVVTVARSLGVEVVDRVGYGLMPSQGILESTLDNQPAIVRANGRQRGDILLMRFTGEPQHLAIFAGETIIHCYESVGQVCEHDLSMQWSRRIVRAYRFAGVTHE